MLLRHKPIHSRENTNHSCLQALLIWSTQLYRDVYTERRVTMPFMLPLCLTPSSTPCKAAPKFTSTGYQEILTGPNWFMHPTVQQIPIRMPNPSNVNGQYPYLDVSGNWSCHTDSSPRTIPTVSRSFNLLSDDASD